MTLFKRPDTGEEIWLTDGTVLDCYGFPDAKLPEPSGA